MCDRFKSYVVDEVSTQIKDYKKREMALLQRNADLDQKRVWKLLSVIGSINRQDIFNEHILVCDTHECSNYFLPEKNGEYMVHQFWRDKCCICEAWHCDECLHNKGWYLKGNIISRNYFCERCIKCLVYPEFYNVKLCEHINTSVIGKRFDGSYCKERFSDYPFFYDDSQLEVSCPKCFYIYDDENSDSGTITNK